MSGGFNRFFKKVEYPNVYEVLKKPDSFASMHYLLTNEYLQKSNDDPTPKSQAVREQNPRFRLTSWAGGSVYFPYQDRAIILAKIAKDAKNGVQQHWNQVAYEDEGMRFAVDVDGHRVITQEEISRLASLMRTTLNDYYHVSIPIFLAICGPRWKAGKESSALHFVCHVRVALEQAKQITFTLQRRFEAFGLEKGLEIDAGIYKDHDHSVNLRMIYCNKVDKCNVCNDETPAKWACAAFCGKTGKLASKFTYVPKFQVGENGELASDLPSYLENVMRYSLWSELDDVQIGYQKPEGEPDVPVKPQKRKLQGDEISHGPKNLKNIRVDGLTQFVRTLSPHWKNVFVDSVNPKHGFSFVNLNGRGSGICPYANKDHGDTRIYGKLSYSGCLTIHCKSEACKSRLDVLEYVVPSQFL